MYKCWGLVTSHPGSQEVIPPHGHAMLVESHPEKEKTLCERYITRFSQKSLNQQFSYTGWGKYAFSSNFNMFEFQIRVLFKSTSTMRAALYSLLWRNDEAHMLHISTKYHTSMAHGSREYELTWFDSIHSRHGIFHGILMEFTGDLMVI